MTPEISQRTIFLTATFAAFEWFLVTRVDRPLSEYLRGLDQTDPGLINLFRAYTDFGKAEIWIIAAAFVTLVCAVIWQVCDKRRRHLPRVLIIGKTAWFFFLSLALTGIVADILKPLFGRARPIELNHDNVYGFYPFTFNHHFSSWPSGHSVTAITLMVLMSYTFPKGRYLWFILAAALALSRIMVNAHFLSDVLAGLFLGFCLTKSMLKLRERKIGHKLTGYVFPTNKQSSEPT